MYGVVVAYNGITFTPDFVKISHLIQKLMHRHTCQQYGYCI